MLDKLLSMQWFKSRKPYKDNVTYDQSYLKVCRDLYNVISPIATKHGVPMSPTALRELTYILTSYFEDQVNHIGIWNTVVNQHQVLYGKRVPFFSAAELEAWADCEDIHPADIHYLLFVFCTFLIDHGVLVVLPGEEFFIAVRDKVFDHLDAIEEVATTDFYESYFLKDGAHVDFKRILTWFTSESYLFGYEFLHKRMKLDATLRKENPGQGEQTIWMNLSIQLELMMYKGNSRLSGLSAVDVLAERLNWPGQKRKDTANAKYLISGNFWLTEDAQYYYFKHTLTAETFPVNKASLGGVVLPTRGGTYACTGLHRWEGGYVVAEALRFEQDKDVIDFLDRENEHEYQVHNSAYRQKLKKAFQDEYEDALAFFGPGPKVYSNGTEVKNAQDEFQQWQYKKAAQEGRIDPEVTKPFPIRDAHVGDVADILVLPSPVDVTMYLTGYYGTLNKLREATVYELMAEGINNWNMPGNALLLIWEHNLPLGPDTGKHWRISSKSDFLALLRILNPYEFSPARLPRMTLRNFVLRQN